MAAQTDEVLNIIRGKNIVGAATKEDILKLYEHIDALENLLDEDDNEDIHGTEGWRHYLGVDE
jgi:hypothetical protein